MRMSPLLQERVLPPGGYFDMETSHQYRKFAEECGRLAKRAENEQHKAILQQMAEVWLRLAAEAEQKGSRRPA
jgi:hypothetical protein